MGGDGCRKVRTAVESCPGELVIGGIGGSSVERLIDHFVVTAEFFLHHTGPSAIDRVPLTSTAFIGDEAPRKGVAEDHDSDRLRKTGTDNHQDGKQTK